MGTATAIAPPTGQEPAREAVIRILRKKVSSGDRASFRIFKWGSPMPDIGERDGGWCVGRRGRESRAEAGRFVDRDCDCRRRCDYGSWEGLGPPPRVADTADWSPETLGRHAAIRH